MTRFAQQLYVSIDIIWKKFRASATMETDCFCTMTASHGRLRTSLIKSPPRLLCDSVLPCVNSGTPERTQGELLAVLRVRIASAGVCQMGHACAAARIVQLASPAFGHFCRAC